MTGPISAQGGSSPFSVGETLIFNLYYGSILAGKQTMTVTEMTTYQGREVFKIVVSMDTAGLGKFFKYKESGVLYLDSKGCFPLFAYREIEDKDKSYWTEVTFNPHTKELVKKSTKNGDVEVKSYKAESGCQEDLSLYYYLRTKPWARGDKEFKFLTKHGPITFDLVAKQGEVLNTPMGKFNTEKVENAKEGYALWFSKDERVLPLLIKKEKITSKLVEVK